MIIPCLVSPHIKGEMNPQNVHVNRDFVPNLPKGEMEMKSNPRGAKQLARLSA
jgi:hypothetical protein